MKQQRRRRRCVWKEIGIVFLSCFEWRKSNGFCVSLVCCVRRMKSYWRWRQQQQKQPRRILARRDNLYGESAIYKNAEKGTAAPTFWISIISFFLLSFCYSSSCSCAHISMSMELLFCNRKQKYCFSSVDHHRRHNHRFKWSNTRAPRCSFILKNIELEHQTIAATISIC